VNVDQLRHGIGGEPMPKIVLSEQGPADHPDTCPIKVTRVFVGNAWWWSVSDGQSCGISPGLLEAVELYRTSKSTA
jgi:hypothetical protein